MTDTYTKTIGAEISFIVQGYIGIDIGMPCVQSIRTYFPDAFIIVSTWVGCDTTGLDADEIICSDDPGFFTTSDSKDARLNNVNRQIVSTLAGLRRASTPYSFKIRSDCTVTSASVVSVWENFIDANSRPELFSLPIIACCYFSRNPNCKPYYPYHPSDLAFFGNTSDLRDLFDVPLMPPNEERWVDNNFYSNRYAPEQYIFISFLRKRGREVICAHYKDVSTENINDTEWLFASNFILVSFSQFGISFSKEYFSMALDPENFRSCYTHGEWLSLRIKYGITSPNEMEIDNDRILIERYCKRVKFVRILVKLMSLFVPNRSARKYLRKYLRGCLIRTAFKIFG